MNTIEVKDDFHRLNKVVKEGMATFVEVGQALAQIREGKLYREAGYKSFEEYSQEELGIPGRKSRRMITAAQVKDLPPGVSLCAAEAIARVPEDIRDEVVERAVDRQGPVPTSTMIEDMQDEVEAELAPPAPPPSVEDRMAAAQEKFRDVYRLLQQAREAAQELGNHDGGALLDVDACGVHLNNAMEEVKFAVPKYRCPYCGGEGCQQCRFSGMLSQKLYELVPIELRPE
ncbi:MAG: hypothetical protein VX951_08930 [Planctomycetota bacterium]|nr:hypothetical protein [Planctomycetota bacterium]